MSTSRSTRRTIAGRVATVAALVLGLSLGLVAPAQASQTTKKDPKGDFVLGDARSGIDLAAVTLRTRKGKKRIQVTFRLHEAVPASTLVRPGGMEVEFRKNKRISRSLGVFSRKGKVRARVCSFNIRQEVPTLRNCSAVKVTRVNGRTYRAVVPRKKIKKGAKVLRWRAASLGMSSGVPTLDALGPGGDAYFRWRL